MLPVLIEAMLIAGVLVRARDLPPLHHRTDRPRTMPMDAGDLRLLYEHELWELAAEEHELQRLECDEGEVL